MSLLKSTLTLRRAFWNKELRKSTMIAAVNQSALELEQTLKNNIDDSTPAGRYYSRSSTRFTSRKGKKRKVIVVDVFRASSPGQPPAKRYNTLYNSLNAKRVPGKLQILASVNAPGVEVLDNPAKLNRPFFRTVIADYRSNGFKNNIAAAINSLIA